MGKVQGNSSVLEPKIKIVNQDLMQHEPLQIERGHYTKLVCLI